MKILYKINNYKAFTLAEVLITLLIIGVVASLVVPNLINDAQNEEFYALLKKDYSALNDAAKYMMIDNGGTLAGYFNNSFILREKFKERMIFTKNCTYSQNGCFYAGTNTWKTLYGDFGWFNHPDYATSIMTNGGTIMFGWESSDCSINYGTGTLAEHTCGIIHLDVNGFKGPNILGRDLYALWVTKTGVYPFGMTHDLVGNLNIFCNKNDSHPWSGRGCAAKVLKGEKVD